ncbi:MAG: hypothetical protein KC684_09850, partial [Candidatus Omnitrophica bacterium]|nr:hypothetical protein [Candidatus Omnitrophota bacterium]
NLLRKSQEEVRRVSQSPANYAILGTAGCDFQGAPPCNFDDISADFPGYARTLTVTNESGSASFKRILVDVTWTELGAPQNLQSVLLLARPPDPLPGNLVGAVTDGDTGDFIAGVQIDLGPPSTGTPVSYSAASIDTIIPRADALITNYDFSSVETGQFRIEPGSWTLRATHSSYEDFGPIDVPDIASNSEAVFNFTMTPKPQDGHLIIEFHNILASPPSAVPINNQARVSLYNDGAQVGSSLHSNTTFDFTIPFDDANSEEFTVATSDLYKAGYVGNFSCEPSVTYARDGWSSAVVPQGSSAGNCGRPWIGNPGLDRLEVGPGETKTEIALVTPVPTATVIGIVMDHTAKPIPNAELYVRWPNGNRYYLSTAPAGYSDAFGRYSISVPAAQSLFPTVGDPSQYMIIWASTTTKHTKCCDIEESAVVTSPQTDPDRRVGPLVAGGVVSKNLIITTTPTRQECGNTTGGIFNDPLSGRSGPIDNAQVNIGGVSKWTNGAGQYLHECEVGQTGYRITIGSPTTLVSRGDYYDFRSTGNAYYNSFSLNVDPGQLNTIPSIRLWPKGFGTLQINVIEKDTGLPVPGANVEVFRSYNNSLVYEEEDLDGDGQVVVSNMEESWPPDAVAADTSGYYSKTPRTFNIIVSYPPDPVNVPNGTVSGVTVKQGQTTTINVILDIPGTF